MITFIVALQEHLTVHLRFAPTHDFSNGTLEEASGSPKIIKEP
jgi:hypothetical protein